MNAIIKRSSVILGLAVVASLAACVPVRQTRSPSITRRIRRRSRWSKPSRPCRARLSIGSLVIGLGLGANGLGFPATTSNDPTKLRPGSPVIGSRAAMAISGSMDAGDSREACAERIGRPTLRYSSRTRAVPPIRLQDRDSCCEARKNKRQCLRALAASCSRKSRARSRSAPSPRAVYARPCKPKHHEPLPTCAAGR